jgi:enamine deaminase RidA (YjgF/YER057c/UK114 family)
MANDSLYVSGQGPAGRDGKTGSACLKFSNVVATDVDPDAVSDFPKMNRVYAQYFPDPKPTTVAQVPPRRDHGPAKKEDVYPSLEQISLIAVR